MKAFLLKLAAMGPLGVFALALVDSMGVPVPAAVDVTLLAVCAARPDLAVWAALAAIIGSLLGNVILFGLARKGGQFYLERHTQGERGHKLRRWFHHYGLLTVFIPALVPIPMPMKAFVICSGALGVSRGWFLATVALARAIRYPALAVLGVNLGTDAPGFLRGHLMELCLIALAVFVVLFGVVKWIDWRRAAHTPETVAHRLEA